MHPEASLRLIQILEKTVSPGMFVKRGKLIQTLIAVQTQNPLPMSHGFVRNVKKCEVSQYLDVHVPLRLSFNR
jgi:hypothetical protein